MSRPSTTHARDLAALIAPVATIALALIYLTSRASGGDSAWVGLPLDDGWIHLVYTRALVGGEWLAYNPGVPEGGMSSPLWVVLLSAIAAGGGPLGLTPQWTAKLASLVCTLAMVLLAYGLGRTLSLSRVWAAVAALLVAADPNLAYGSVGGMEPALASAWTMLAIIAVQRERYWLTGLALGLGLLTRAEGALTAVVIGAIPLVQLVSTRTEVTLVTRREAEVGGALFGPSAVLGVLWVLASLRATGLPFPNSYYVKRDLLLAPLSVENLGNTLLGYMGHLAYFQGPLLLVTLLCCAVAVVASFRRRQALAVLPLWLVPLAQVYAFSVTIRVTAEATPWTYFTRRYLDVLLPLVIVLGVYGAAAIWSWASARRHPVAVLGTPLGALAVVGLLALQLGTLHRTFIETYSWNTANIERTQVAMGRWIADTLPPGSTIAVTDAGALRYFARPDQTVIDALGLNCHGCMGRPFNDIVHEYHPQYVVLFEERNIPESYYEPLHTIAVEHNTIVGGSELIVARVRAIPPWPPE